MPAFIGHGGGCACVSGLRGILGCVGDPEGIGGSWGYQGFGVDGGCWGVLGALWFLGGSGRSWLPGVTWSACVERWENPREDLQRDVEAMGILGDTGVPVVPLGRELRVLGCVREGAGSHGSPNQYFRCGLMSAEQRGIITSLGLLAMLLLTQPRLLLLCLCCQDACLDLVHLSVDEDTQVLFHSSAPQPVGPPPALLWSFFQGTGLCICPC